MPIAVWTQERSATILKKGVVKVAGMIYCTWEGTFFEFDRSVFTPWGDAYLHDDLGHTTDGLKYPPADIPPPTEVLGPSGGQE